MSYARLVLVLSALGALVLGGCESQVAKCNHARVGAHDAWDAVRAQLGPLCSSLDRNPQWERERQDTHASLRGFSAGFGGISSGFGVTVAYEEYAPRLSTACRAVAAASQSATGPAVAARDASRAASAALADVFANHRKFAAAIAHEASTASRFQVLAEDARAHSTAMAALERTGLAARAQAAANANWEACNEIAP